MSCEEMRAKLDAYIDGELSAEEMRAMEDHAAACADCGRELELAKLVCGALGEMDKEVAVPLNVQAGWRNAVRAEAKRRKMRRWTRAAYAVAAALVLVIGATAMLRNAPARTQMDSTRSMDSMEMMDSAMLDVSPTDAVVARDGEMQAASAALEEEAYAAWKKYSAADFDAACASVEALIQEYSGSFQTVNQEEGPMIYRIELPREYLEDFLSAVCHVGAEQDSETMDTQGETALVYIQIDQENAN